MAIDFDNDLNPEQRAAALAPDGPVLVVAAAGTGKTRTLTYRVAHLVERGVETPRILLLTFTNRAAREMLDRARLLAGPGVAGIWGGTFHHFANRLLRRHAPRAGYGSDFAILDEDDARSVMRACTAAVRKAQPHFPKPEALLDAISLARNRDVPVEPAVLEQFGELAVPPDTLRAAVRDYAAHKLRMNAMDFDDLLAQGLRLLETCPDLLARYQEQFLHVLVDEYQDTNPLQARLVDAVAARHRNLLVVGDDFQSIYAWRGADYRNFLSFPGRYPDAKVFKLETNYRSVPGVLDVANACIAGNPEQFQKTLRAVRPEGVRPVRVDLRDGSQQARYVLQAIAAMRREGYRLRDMAILYRSHFNAMELQLELTRGGVPYAITSGIRFFEQAHVKDVLAPLRLTVRPNDELAFVRMLGLFPRTGERTAQKIWARIGGRFSPQSAADLEKVGKAMPAAARADWDALAAAMRDVKDATDGGDLAGRFVEAVYRRYATETFDNPDRRIDDVDEMVRYMSRFPTLADFLSEVALLTNVDTGGQRDAVVDEDHVLLSTVHQAKGLEWPVVFVLWMAEGIFPSGRTINDEASGGVSEERRLFYVATTRAKDHLFLCVPKMRRGRDGDFNYYSPSRFLEEIPSGLLLRERAEYDI
ncbi:MAG: ATP-dependent helicase [Lentisphaerae bacterium]|nr:ATP-dependent helicase [Lentisphaerota bacterium]